MFSNYTEDEGNIVSKFIKNNMLSIDIIKPIHNSMNYSNNFTYIGTRHDINNSNCRRHFRSNNGFIIEPIELNKIYQSGNI